ncbi:SEL1-like repeat protein [Colwellia sp. E2M01]|uniref:SEL1-like repeat protein n=1 Tax=Colwellia sp. E2M01 TaxID=2841561 RepID=UPI001C09689C|nr:SEL1-like repeat protein [Colwellia sp. E2M01]MBU2870463.1 SEL1-like repeat protein [Colwellia sp. E2M01]
MPQAAIRKYEDEQMPIADVDQQDVSEAESDEAVLASENSSEKTTEEPYYHYTIDTKDPDPFLVKHKTKLISAMLFAGSIVAGLVFYKSYELNEFTKSYIAEPQVNDLYYVDFRLIKDNLRPAEKYRMAKVKDITGDVVTINFSSYFYMQEHELNEAIRYAQLRYEKFFQEKRHNFKISELEAMVESGAITLARRPVSNMLDGNVVVPDSHFKSSSVFIPGKKENFAGLEHLKYAKNDPARAEEAFEKFEESADYGFAAGQVNLAQMYLNGMVVEKDMHEALALFNEASLKGYEPAILKYAIVCEQVESCMVSDFYKELVAAGVNIEFTKQVDVRATTEQFERDLKTAEEKRLKAARL